MGTDCKSAAFSFGGSNPPAPTKKTSVENTLVFFFCKNPKSHPRGWIRTAAARRLRPAGQKSPGGAFLAARLAEQPAPTKKTSVEIRWSFSFVKTQSHTLRGWIRTAAARRLRPAGQKSPGGAFRAARLAEQPTSPAQKDQRRKYAGLFPLQKPKVTPSRVDFEQLRPGACVPPGKKAPVGLF